MLRTSVISLLFLCTPLVAHAQQGKVTPKNQPSEQVKKEKPTRLKHTGLKRTRPSDKVLGKGAGKDRKRRADKMQKSGPSAKKLSDVGRKRASNKPADAIVDAELRKLLGELEKGKGNKEKSASESSSASNSASQHSSDKDSSSSKQTSSSSHRVVVVNGKTIVDEKTSTGKQARPGANKPGQCDPEKFVKDLDLEGMVKDAMKDAKKKGAKKGHTSSSGGTRRLVVVNGKTVVDEQTTNGKPTKSNGAKKPSKELEDLLRDLGKKDPAMRDVDLERRLKRLRDAEKARGARKPKKPSNGSPARPAVPSKGKKKG